MQRGACHWTFLRIAKLIFSRRSTARCLHSPRAGQSVHGHLVQALVPNMAMVSGCRPAQYWRSRLVTGSLSWPCHVRMLGHVTCRSWILITLWASVVVLTQWWRLSIACWMMSRKPHCGGCTSVLCLLTKEEYRQYVNLENELWLAGERTTDRNKFGEGGAKI